jgi:hypothetical protein
VAAQANRRSERSNKQRTEYGLSEKERSVMKRTTITIAVLALTGIVASANAAEIVMFFTSPVAINAAARGPVTAAAEGATPIISKDYVDQNPLIPVQIWLQVNYAQANPAYHYTQVFGGAFEIVSPDGGAISGNSLSLFRAYNTPVASRRWDSAFSRNGRRGQPSTGQAKTTLWEDVLFLGGFQTGINPSVPDSPAPAGPDVGVGSGAFYLLADMLLDVKEKAVTQSGFFDVYFSLSGGWGCQTTPVVSPDPHFGVCSLAHGWAPGGGPDTSTGYLAHPNDPKGYFASSDNFGMQSDHPDLRIEANIPEPGTLLLLSIGGVLLGRRRMA